MTLMDRVIVSGVVVKNKKTDEKTNKHRVYVLSRGCTLECIDYSFFEKQKVQSLPPYIIHYIPGYMCSNDTVLHLRFV